VLDDVGTTKSIVAALTADGARVGSNAFISDVFVADYSEKNGGVCSTAKTTIGACIELDGGCWKHSHPHERNVYGAQKKATSELMMIEDAIGLDS
jgi:hypothetical protein